MNVSRNKNITGIIIALIAVLMMILGYILFSRSLEQRFGRDGESADYGIAQSVLAMRSAPKHDPPTRL